MAAMINFSFFMLNTDIVFNLLSIVLCALLLFRAKDDKLKIAWGILVAICSASMLFDNLQWWERFEGSWGLDERAHLLVLDRMLRWYLFVHLISLFPLASLRPGWLTPFRFTVFSLPLICSSLMCLCYLWFNGNITTLLSLHDVFQNIGKLDVQIRIGYFIISIIIPSIYLLIPFMGKWITLKRKLNVGMYIYIFGSFVSVISYILFAIGTTDLVFDIYAFLVTFIPALITFLYLRKENPFSSPKPLSEIELNIENPPATELNAVSPIVYRLSLQMNEFMQTSTPFSNPDYKLRQMAVDLNTNQSQLLKAIQYAGYTGFSEYINCQRLEYFKRIAAGSPGASIKEMMFKCGFTSRSSFYRRFAEKENMSPKEYIEKNIEP